MSQAGHYLSWRDVGDPIEGAVRVDFLLTLQQIVPELEDLLERRYSLLRAIGNQAPVGRRLLASQITCSERTIRGELHLLREQGLILSSSAGVRLTERGEAVLAKLQKMVRDFRDLEFLENKLAHALGVGRMIIVPGDSDTEPGVKQDLGVATARYLRHVLRDGDILAVTGGTTLAQVADFFPEGSDSRQVTVVPVRGGLGEDVKIQANTVAARLAGGLGGRYRLLHAPEDVLPGHLNQMLNEPRIRDVIALGRRADILLHGIGTAEEMAKRRGFDEAAIMELIASGAVGEAFGYYFDAKGNIIYSTTSVGLRLADLEKIPLVITVGGGRSKAWAVQAVLARGYCDVCITDEGVARRLMSLEGIEKYKEDLHEH